jgi:hypothetical protein
VIAAIEGYAVAGGLEMALWATCGWWVKARCSVCLPPLGCDRPGTVRLPRLIGASRAMDLILTGRPVGAREAFEIGLVNRLAPQGQALAAALELAAQLSAFPQTCLRNDRLSALGQWSLDWDAATAREAELGRASLATGESRAGAQAFSGGQGRESAVKAVQVAIDAHDQSFRVDVTADDFALCRRQRGRRDRSPPGRADRCELMVGAPAAADAVARAQPSLRSPSACTGAGRSGPTLLPQQVSHLVDSRGLFGTTWPPRVTMFFSPIARRQLAARSPP